MSTSTPAPSPSFLSRVPLATKIVSIGVVGVLGLVLLAVSMWAGSSAMSSAAERREAQATVTENAARLATLDQRLQTARRLTTKQTALTPYPGQHERQGAREREPARKQPSPRSGLALR